MASDTVLALEDIIDNTKDPFTGVVTPVKIGLGDRPSEFRTIPASSPYQVKLFHVPIQGDVSWFDIDIVSPATPLTEVPATQTPAANEYRVNYDEDSNGIIEFNAVHTGRQAEIKYYAQATLLRQQVFSTLFQKITAEYRDSSGVESTVSVKIKIIEIGNWDMDTIAGVNFAHGIANGATKIRSIDALVRRDDLTSVFKLNTKSTLATTNDCNGGISFNDTFISLVRLTGGIFDDTIFDDNTINRGWVHISYEV